MNWQVAKAYFNLLMAADPSPVSYGDNAKNVAHADLIAARFGFTSWIEAFHADGPKKKRLGMKLGDVAIGDEVWFAKSFGTPLKYRVVGMLDRGQSKYVALHSNNDQFYVLGSQSGDNGYGWDADFAFATSLEQWAESAIESLTNFTNSFPEVPNHFFFIRGNNCYREVKS